MPTHAIREEPTTPGTQVAEMPNPLHPDGPPAETRVERPALWTTLVARVNAAPVHAVARARPLDRPEAR